MEIEKVTIGEAREIASLIGNYGGNNGGNVGWKHPYVGKRVLVRTYSAGVHIGTLKSVNPNNVKECELVDALRLWKWEGGGLSLSAVAHNGIKGGRLNKTDSVVLTEAIEYIPVTATADKTFLKYVEDDES